MSEGGCVLSNPTKSGLYTCVCTPMVFSKPEFRGTAQRLFMKNLIKRLVVFGKTERTTEYRRKSLVHDGLQHAVPVTAAEQLRAGS